MKKKEDASHNERLQNLHVAYREYRVQKEGQNGLADGIYNHRRHGDRVMLGSIINELGGEKMATGPDDITAADLNRIKTVCDKIVDEDPTKKGTFDLIISSLGSNDRTIRQGAWERLTFECGKPDDFSLVCLEIK